ncbi:hypothetical protein EC991_001060 [Linnemannia zychae]|nr:hypothetical protein EC991_001060 [Linnemannia zychae]
MSPSHPLELPEIIACVGYFLPLWAQELSEDTHRLETVLRPKTFHACLLVSKLWRQTLLPIFWALYDAEGMHHVPRDVLKRYSPHFRTFFMQQGQVVSTYGCTLLTSATLNPSIEDLEELRQLLRTNRGIRSLEWNGPNGAEPLAPDEFANLPQLDTLSLTQWDISDGRLSQALAPLAGKLRKLDLGWFTTNNDDSGNDLGDYDVGNHLLLPHVEFIRATGLPYGIDISEIAGLCPNLSRLDLTLLKSDIDSYEEDGTSAKRIADCLRIHCPKLSALALRGTIAQKHQDTLIRNCTAACSGLTELVVVLSSIDESTLDFIIPHAPTLETLGILNVTNEDASEKNLFRMPAICPRLKWFSVAAWSCWEVKGQDIIRALRVSTWRCRELEVLDVDIQELDPDSDFETPAGNDSISMDKLFKDGPIQGWYYHTENFTLQDEGERVSLSEGVVRALFEAVQGLEKLRLLRWSGAIFTRSSSRASAEFDGMPFIYFDS